MEVLGEDVTNNVKTIHSIPLEIAEKSLIEIRGEIVIKKLILKKINQERLLNNEQVLQIQETQQQEVCDNLTLK